MKKYDNDSIKSLGILGGVRAKPASVGIENQNHTFIEILANAIDEANAGYGNEIIVIKNKDGSVTVRDFGRGVPMDKNKDGEYAYKKVFDELWAGGKYDNNKSEDGNYKYSLGTNGLGACSTNYTSDFFIANAWYGDGKKYTVKYTKGVENKDGLIIADDDEPRGTKITWKPSAEVFRGKSEIDDDFIIATLEDQAVVNGGLKFTFINDKTGEKTEYYYENGVVDYIKSLSNEDHVLTDVAFFSTEKKGRDNEEDEDYKIKADIYFSFNRETSFSRYYHNSSWLENGGTPEDFIKNSFTYVIDKFLKEQNMYNKNEKKISFDDISDSLIIVTSTYSTISLFSDQTKKKIKSDFMKQAITEWLREQLEIYFIENPNETKLILSQVLVNKRSREKAESIRLDVKKKLSGNINSIDNRVNGFYNCKSKDKSKNILTICEGKSALSAILSGRQDIHAIFPIRGKILNCLKAPLDVILKNEVVTNLIKVLGCGIEVGRDKSNFNIDNLNFSKIMIYVDSDYDGVGSILPLLLTVFWKLTPTLVKQGRIYLCETPRYEVTVGDDHYYAVDDDELEELKEKLKDKKYHIHYVKGLAELSEEAMAMCLDPNYKNVTQITLDNIEESIEMLEMFMGTEIKERKKVILNSFEE